MTWFLEDRSDGRTKDANRGEEDIVGEPETKLMHPKYTNVKYVFLYIKIYEKHDFHVAQAKLAAYAWFFYIYVK